MDWKVGCHNLESTALHWFLSREDLVVSPVRLDTMVETVLSSPESTV